MKVENPRPGMTAPPVQTDAIDSGRPTPTQPTAVSSDTVQLSGDLRLAYQAVKAAGSTEIRPDAVARGRALLESGQLGTDVTGLADRMLDAMSDPHDTDNS